MPDFEHFRFSCSNMTSLLGESSFLPPPPPPLYLPHNSPDPGHLLGDPSGFSPEHLSSLDPPGLAYLHLPLHRAPPAASVLRNDLGSNICVLKTLNLRFRCFLAKVHELERRNRLLEAQLQGALQGGRLEEAQRLMTREAGVQTGFIAPIRTRPGYIPNDNDPAYLPGGILSPTLNPPPLLSPTLNPPPLLSPTLNPPPLLSPTLNPPPLLSPTLSPLPLLSPTLSPPPLLETHRLQTTDRNNPNLNARRFLPNLWTLRSRRRVSGSGSGSGPAWDSLSGSGSGPAWDCPDGVGVQIDTITPEIRALYNVLGKVKRERDEYKRRWEEEYTARVELQDRVAQLDDELQESEVVQDKLSLSVKHLKAELVLFKGLVSRDLSELDSQIQEKALKVDMDICRRIDITAKLCDMFQVSTPPSTLVRRTRKLSGQSVKASSDGDEVSSLSESEGGGPKDEESSASANQISEQVQRMLNQLRECDFEDDCDSLAWEETEETLLLWEDFPGSEAQTEHQEESIEKVIDDTESLFKTREKEYQETIDQIEGELATAKSDMTRHLHEYVEMCTMKRGLDVQMETCRRLITGTRKSPLVLVAAAEDSSVDDREKKKPPDLDSHSDC